VTHFSNCVVWVATGSSGFKMRSVLVRQLPYFCGSGIGHVSGGGAGGGGGAPPPIGLRDKSTTAAIGGHAGRTFNWTAGANNIGAMIFLQGASNVEISDCDLTCTQWCLKSSEIPYFPMRNDGTLPTRDGPQPHHIYIQRNLVHNADVAFAVGGVSQSIM
jgi:hypothetical protein